jgi:hypothetical protein
MGAAVASRRRCSSSCLWCLPTAYLGLLQLILVGLDPVHPPKQQTACGVQDLVWQPVAGSAAPLHSPTVCTMAGGTLPGACPLCRGPVKLWRCSRSRPVGWSASRWPFWITQLPASADSRPGQTDAFAPGRGWRRQRWHSQLAAAAAPCRAADAVEETTAAACWAAKPRGRGRCRMAGVWCRHQAVAPQLLLQTTGGWGTMVQCWQLKCIDCVLSTSGWLVPPVCNIPSLLGDLQRVEGSSFLLCPDLRHILGCSVSQHRWTHDHSTD